MNVVICICTFRNPVGLAKLLAAIDIQALDGTAGHQLSIVVVDNDPDRSATEVLSGYGRTGRFQLHAQYEPRRGLASARNAALDSNSVRNSDYFAFIDDDEHPSERWIQSLLDAVRASSTAVVIGPVQPIFRVHPPNWIIEGRFFSKCCDSPEGNYEGYTSNVMVRYSIVAAAGVRFDESLNQIGGEDVLFFKQLREKGHSIECVPEAIVFEDIPQDRASIGWLLRRWLRAGVTSARLRRHSMSPFKARLGNGFGGVGRILAGIVLVMITAVVQGWSSFAPVVKRMATVCRGIGMLLVALGGSYEEYGNTYRRKVG